MKYHRLMIGIAMLVCNAAQAAIENIEASFELSPEQVTLPDADSGKLTLRQCPSCAIESLLIDADTSYVLRPGTTSVDHGQFGIALRRSAGQNGALLLVFYDPRDRHVRRLILNPGR